MLKNSNDVSKYYTSAFVLDKPKLTRVLNIIEDKFKESQLSFEPKFEVTHFDGKKVISKTLEDLITLDNTTKNPITKLEVSAINTDIKVDSISLFRGGFQFSDEERRNICESVVKNEQKESDCQFSPAMDHQRIS